MSTNPLVSEIDALSPAAKQALQSAHEQAAPHTAGLIAPPVNSPVPHLSASQPVTPGAQQMEMPQQTPHQERLIPPTGRFTPSGTQLPPGLHTRENPTDSPDGSPDAHPKIKVPDYATQALTQYNGPKSMPVPGMGSSAPPPLMPAGPKVNAPLGTAEGDSNERQRLIQSGSGISQIKTPWKRGLAEAANDIGTVFAPGIARLVPGTEEHHQMLLNKTNSNLETDLGNDTKTGLIAKTAEENKEAPQKAEDLHDLTQHTVEGEAWTPLAGVLGPNGEPVEVNHRTGEARLGDVSGLTPMKPPKADSPEQQYLDEYAKMHPGSTVGEAERKYTLDTQRPPQIAPTMVFNPNPNGGFDAAAVRPGGHVSEGAVTPGGMSGENVASNKKDAAKVEQVKALDSELGLMKQFAAQPSPTNDAAMLMHYIGATKPESMGKIRLNDKEMKLFGGTRSSLGDAEALLTKVANGQMLTPQQRTDMINTMTAIAGAAHRDGGESAPTSDMITVQIPGQAPGQIHSSQWEAFHSKHPDGVKK